MSLERGKGEYYREVTTLRHPNGSLLATAHWKLSAVFAREVVAAYAQALQ